MNERYHSPVAKPSRDNVAFSERRAARNLEALPCRFVQQHEGGDV